MPRRAKLEAQSITVTCPYCYEPQSERLSGSTNWTPDDIDRNQGGLKCSACGCDMALIYAGKVDAPRSVRPGFPDPMARSSHTKKRVAP